MNLQEEIVKANVFLGYRKLLILQQISKTCSPIILTKIVQECPFLLSNEPMDEPSLYNCQYIPSTTAEEIGEILRQTVLPNDFNYSPLEMVVLNLKNEVLYNAVKFLINCGVQVNVKNKFNETPLSALCSRYDENMKWKTFRLLLKNGKGAFEALRHENKFRRILDLAIITTKSYADKLRIAKLLLEFGAKPNWNLSWNSVHHILPGKFMCKEKYEVMELFQLLMQYVLIYRFRYNLSKVKKLVSDGEYDKILDLSFLSSSICFNEVKKYRNRLINDMTAMVFDNIDNKMTVFSFISKQCTSGLNYHNNDKPYLFKILGLMRLKHYDSCDRLFYASVKRDAMLPILSNQCIFVKKLSGQRVILNSDSILYLASYLSRKDIIHLIHSYWVEPSKNEKIPKRNLRKRSRECFLDQIIEDDSTFDNSFSVTNKCIKLNKK